MESVRKLQKMFLYAGLEEEEYHALGPGIRKENSVLLKVFSRLGAVMFFLLLIASMVTRGFAAVNSKTYLTCAVAMLVILLCVRFLTPKHPSLVMLFVYLFEITLYAFGIYVSMLHAEKAAVSAVAFLLVTPLLFYDRPIRVSSLLLVVVAVFCVIVVRYKDPYVAETDVWNMTTFGVVAIASALFIMRIKIRALAQSRQIEYLSQTDLLTGLKNRNHYENRLSGYPGICSSNLVFVYADVNGLHEMNNSKGHAAGDRMLCEVAARLQQCFGSEHTYRIGGDEFACFRADTQPEAVYAELDRIRQQLAANGYHVSFGISARDKIDGALDVQELVKEAEGKMYVAKREFYRDPGHNRRNR